MDPIPLANPCTPGTLKHATCQAAIDRLSATDTEAKLEKMKRGAGARLLEYVSDLRAEEHLDVRIVNGRLGVYGTS